MSNEFQHVVEEAATGADRDAAAAKPVPEEPPQHLSG
jgi:hypothetical protein